MYKRRIKIFLAIMAVVFLGLAVRLWHLQIVQGDDYRRQAEDLLRTTKSLPATRGRILDRRGRLLAVDEACYDFCLDYRFLTNDPKWVARQKRAIARGEQVSGEQAAKRYELRAERTWELAWRLARAADVDLERTVARIRRRVQAVRDIVGMEVREQRSFHPVVRGLSEMMGIEGTIGASVRPSLKRWYPFGESACHVIGVTGQVNSAEKSEYNLTTRQADRLTRMRTNYLPGDTIGKSGVEKMCEKTLRRVRGYRLVRRTEHGSEILAEMPGRPGDDVHLTIDIDFQRDLTNLLRATDKNGCIVVLSVPTGEVLALVSVPTFDLNSYRRDYNKLAGDHLDLPLLHRAVWCRYPPGSTVKPISVLAGLGAGVITPATTFQCRGYLYSPSAFRCWIWKYRRGHGTLAVTGAIKNSCNVFCYNVGNRLGARRLCEWFNMFGFGNVPGTGLPEERAGTVPTERWLMAKYNRRFRPADARFMTIGQGLITCTPLHVANAMATIARNGRLLSPILALEGGPKRVRCDLPLAAEHLEAVQKGMYQVVNERGGTAYKVFHAGGVSPAVAVCGKTGTAETPPQRVDSNGNGRIDSGDRIVREGDTAWFAGFAPYKNPQIAFAVVMEYAGSGSKNAGPVAREMIRIWSRQKYRHLH